MEASRSRRRLTLRPKILGTAILLIAASAVIGLVGFLQLGAANDRADVMYGDLLIGESQISGMAQAELQIEADLATAIVTTDATQQASLLTEVANQEQEFNQHLSTAYASDTDGLDKPTLDAIKGGWTAFVAAVDQKAVTPLKNHDAAAAQTALSDITALHRTLSTELGNAETAKLNVAKQSNAAGHDAAGQAAMMLIGLLIVAAIVGMAISWVLARGITRGVKAVQEVLTSMADNCASYLENGLAAFAENDLTVEVHPVSHPIEKYGQDEIGDTAAVTNKMLRKLQTTIDSYEKARAGLAVTVNEVKQAAEEVMRTSTDLNAAATQSGSASGQIAQTINQVAAGAGEQAKAASETSNAVIDLASIIGQVGVGAADTSRTVESASRALSQMATAIASASKASEDVKGVAAGAAEAASEGQKAVRQTVTEMDRIKLTVESASLKVTELGAKSDQIGAIVEVIDDIAEQTNLLALNAAIEAARAGEQGKGFAVVADEVRKLAERSGRATKEIASLIAEVQKGTNQAVEAMQSGAAEVEQGSELANRAGASLDELTMAVDATKAAVVRITDSVEAMSVASDGVVAASDAIATIAEQTNASATRMTSAADTVGRSVQAIAAISEENSASAEEVSAATEEMSGQAEEVVAAASSLAEMARQLDQLVARFKIHADVTSAAGSASRSAPTSVQAYQSRRRAA